MKTPVHLSFEACIVHVLHKWLLKAMNSLSFSMPNMRCGGIVIFLISPLHAPCNPMSMPFALFPRYQPFFTTSVLGLVVKWTNSFIFEKEFEYLKTHADILKRKIEKKYVYHDNGYGIMKNSVRWMLFSELLNRKSCYFFQLFTMTTGYIRCLVTVNYVSWILTCMK